MFELERKAESYARIRNARVVDCLGAGVQGMVFLFVDNITKGRYAVKVHQYQEAYQRECAVYHRLKEREVDLVDGFQVPRFIQSNDEWVAIEMTIVTKPYVLDFAGAYMDFKPEFSEDVWTDMEEKGRILTLLPRKMG